MSRFVISQIFLAWDVEVGPVGGAEADDSLGANAFGDEVGLKADLDSAAAQGHCSFRFDDFE